MCRRLLVVAVLLAACQGAGPPGEPTPPGLDLEVATHRVHGRVTSGGKGLAGAVVKFGGRRESVVTAEDGSFTLEWVGAIRFDQIALTAGKPGYWNAGLEVGDP